MLQDFQNKDFSLSILTLHEKVLFLPFFLQNNLGSHLKYIQVWHFFNITISSKIQTCMCQCARAHIHLKVTKKLGKVRDSLSPENFPEPVYDTNNHSLMLAFLKKFGLMYCSRFWDTVLLISSKNEETLREMT